MSKKRIVIVGFIVAILGIYLFLCRIDCGPYPVHSPIVIEYFQCEKCKSLDGGIYGKGPHKRIQSTDGNWCVHDWRKINRADFKQAGLERFGIDWTKEIDFWAKN